MTYSTRPPYAFDVLFDLRPFPAQEIDPVENVDTLAGSQEHDLAFPFAMTTEG